MLDPYLRVIATSYEGIALIAQERARPTHLHLLVVDDATVHQLRRDEVLEGYTWTATTTLHDGQAVEEATS